MNLKFPDYISNSQLTAFKKSPAHWIQYITETKAQTDAMLLGSVAHCISQGETAEQRLKYLETEFFVMDTKQRPDRSRNFVATVNKKWKDDMLERAKESGKTLINDETLDTAVNCVIALYEDTEARKYIDGEKEAVIEWESLGFKFKGIRDRSHDNYITDLKFVNNADPFVFQRYLFREGIYRQGGMYLDGEMKGEFTGDPHKRVFFIAVETIPPHGVSVHELDYEVIQDGVNEYRRLADQLKTCIDAGHFPSYQFRSIDGTFSVTRPTFMPTE